MPQILNGEKMAAKEASHAHESTRSRVYLLLILLIAEKIVQHIFVTLAFYFNWGDIASTVVVSPSALMILGALIAVLFVLSFWGMIRKRIWATNLVIVLSLSDIVGEFVAQGKIAIVITVSFIVAIVLLVLALIYRRPSQIAA
jgi:hypothetical protein